MSTAGIVAEEIDKQAALAGAAFQPISEIRAGKDAKQALPRAVLALLTPYSAMRYFAERVIESAEFDVELVRGLHARLLTFERMAEDVLATAQERGYFNEPDIAGPLHWLEACNDDVKDCMVALEAMLDPRLDDVMAAAKREYLRRETVSLDSIP